MPKKMIALEMEEQEIKVLNSLSIKLNLSRSELMRVLMFQQLEPEVADWLIPLARKKGVAPWQYVNIILQTFKERALRADAKKRKKPEKVVMAMLASSN